MGVGFSLFIATGGLHFDAAEGEAGGENGEESVGAKVEGDAIGEGNEAKADEFVAAEGFVVVLIKTDDKFADKRTKNRADGEATCDGPEDVDEEPACAKVTEFVCAKKAEAEHDKGKRRAVVEAGFASEAEAEAVAVAGVLELDVGG